MTRVDGEQIRRLRESRRWTQEDLAARLGVGKNTIGNWERGFSVPKNRMGALRELFALDGNSDASDPIRAASDVELLSELLRRAALREGRTRSG